MKKSKAPIKHSKSNVTTKKISFFSSVLLVIGSTIGSGIFLKNGEILGNVSNSIILSIVSWILSIIAVICMGLSLIEMTSNVPNDNGGIISWLKVYTHPILFKAAKNFMAYMYFPASAVIMPYYAIMMVQDAFGLQMQWWWAIIISLVIALWFTIASGLSTKVGNVQNKIMTYIKFLPLLFAIVVGFIIVICHQSHIGEENWPHWLNEASSSSKEGHNFLVNYLPSLGIIGSIPAIAFSFDGFYTCANLKCEMQQPQKIGQSMLYGLIIVSIIDVILSLSLLIGSQNGKISGLQWFNDNKYHWVISVIELLITISILGIINGICMGQAKFYEHCIKINELYCPQKYKNMINDNQSIVGVGYFLVLYIPIFLFVSFVGSFAYLDINKYGATNMINISNVEVGTGYQIANNSLASLNKLYSFCDLIGNWTSIIAFCFILLAIFGCMLNRKTHRVPVKKEKYFLPTAIISSVILIVGLLFVLVSAIGNIFIVLSWKKDINTLINESKYTYQEWFEQLIGVCLTLFVLVFLMSISFIPATINYHRKKIVNIQKYKH